MTSLGDDIMGTDAMVENLKLTSSGTFVLRPKGHLNVVVAPALREQLTSRIAAGNARIAVDLTDVPAIDAAAIGSLIGGLKLARQAGGDLRLVAASARVREVLAMANLTRLLQVCPSVGEAFDV